MKKLVLAAALTTFVLPAFAFANDGTPAQLNDPLKSSVGANAGEKPTPSPPPIPLPRSRP